MICALHGSVSGNIGADQGLYAHALHFFAERRGRQSGFLLPAPDGRESVLDVDTHGDFFAVFFHGPLGKVRLRHRRRAQNDPVDSGGKVALHGLHAADSAAGKAADPGSGFQRDRRTFEPACREKSRKIPDGRFFRGDPGRRLFLYF